MTAPHLRVAWAVALLAAAARLAFLDWTAYNIDEATTSIFATQAAHLRNTPLVGLRTSFGFHNPPLFIYLLAPAFRITTDPRAAMAMLALASALAPVLAGAAAARLAPEDRRTAAGCAAAIALAFSANALDHGRRLWGHDVVILFAAACAYAAVRGAQEKDWRWLAGSCAAAAAAQACHLSGALLWILPLGAMVLFKPPGRAKALAAAAIVLAAIHAPWAVHIVREDPGQLRLLADLLRGGAASEARAAPVAPAAAWLLALSDSGHSDHLGGAHPPGDGAASMAFAALRLATIPALLAAIAALAFGAWRGRDGDARRWSALLLASALAPLAAFGLAAMPTVPPYQLPAVVPLALGIGALAAARPRWGFAAAGIVAASGIALFAATQAAIARTSWERPGPALLSHKRQAIAWIAADGAGSRYAVNQDARAAFDTWVLFLHFVETGESRTPDVDDAEVLFVLRDVRVRIRPEAQALLASPVPAPEFGPLRVHRLEGARAREFKRLARPWVEE